MGGGADEQVRAAGGVLWRTGARGEVEVLLVHRPRYDDWSFPKGKRDPGESDAQCAAREVQEETGLRPRLGEELVPPVEYADKHGRPKVVRYWEMTTDDAEFVANDEVDEVAWLPVRKARKRLSYPHDRGPLDVFAERLAARQG